MTNPTPAASNDTYKLGRRLNAGSTGVIYEAKHPWLPGRFAVKVLRNALAQMPEAVNIFRAELAAVSSLAHPNIVHIVEVGSTPDGIPFVVMELLEGRPLAARVLEGRPVPVSEVVGIVKGVAAGLDAAHNRGVIHCELNPGNIFLAAAGGEEFGYSPKILNFGIARLRNSNGGDAGVGADTARTMAPEQAQGRGDEIDGRTDQFALAAIAYRMITGVDAFRGDDAIGVLYQVVHEAPPPISDYTRVDPRIEAVLRRALAKRRSDRFDSMAAFAHALDESASQGPYQDDTGMRMVANGEPVTATPVPGSEPHLAQPRVSPFERAPVGSQRAGAPLAQDTALTPPRHRPPLAFAHPRGGVLKDSGEWTADEEPLELGDERIRVPKERWRITVFLAALVVVSVGVSWWAGWRPPLAWRQSQLWQALHLPAAGSEPVNIEVEKPAAPMEPAAVAPAAVAPAAPPAAPTPTMETPLPAAAVAVAPDAGAAAVAVPPPVEVPAPAAAPVAAAPTPPPAASPDDDKERKARERAKRRREELEAERDLVWSEEAGRLVPSDWTPPSERRRSRQQEPAPAPPPSSRAAPPTPAPSPSPSSPAPPASPGIAPPSSIGSMGAGSGAPAEKPAPVPTQPARP